MREMQEDKTELIRGLQELRRYANKAEVPQCRETSGDLFPVLDQKQDQELIAVKDYLKTVFNKIHDALFVHDTNGIIVDVNEKLLQLYRCSREDAIGAHIHYDFSAPELPLLDYHQNILWKKVMAGEDQLFEWKARRPGDGSIFDVEVCLAKLSLPHGEFILASTRDITERKRVEQDLIATKDYLRTVFNKIHDALFVHDSDGIIVDVNENLLRLYKCTREEVIGFHIHPRFSGENQALTDYHKYALWKKVMAGEDQLFEWKARRPGDGSIFDVEVCLAKLSLPHGEFILASCRDITHRKRIEKLLIKEKEVFFSVMNDNPHGIALFDDLGRFLYFNPEFTAITGYTLEDVSTGHEWAERAYPDPEYRAKVIKFWKDDKARKGRGQDVEWRIVCKNGEYKYVEFRVTYLGDKSLVVLTDTTLRNRAEEELRTEKQKFQVLSESSPVGMLMLGADDQVKYINPKFKELFGYDLTEIPDLKSWFLRAYPKPSYRRQVILERLQDLTYGRPGELRPYVSKVTCGNGTQKYINFMPVRLEEGETLLTCEDITKGKEARDKIRERNLELEVLNDIITSVSSSLHLPEILETLTKVFAGKLKIPVGGVFFHDEFDNRLTMQMCWGISDTMKPDFEAFALSRYHSETFAGANGPPFMETRSHPRQPDDWPIHKFLERWHRYLCAPLNVKGEIQGMILLIDKASGVLRDDQIAFFRTLVQQIGVAIQNARLFEQVQQSNLEMKALSLRLVSVQEAELRHIARELHDEIGQWLTGLMLALEMALQSPETSTSNLLVAKSHANTLTNLVRELSRNLRPSMLDDLGLLLTLPWLFERFSGQTNIRVVFEHSTVDSKRFPHEIETAVYRVVQEALTNVARHARVDVVTVRLWSNNEMLGVQIEDQGVGFDFSAALRARNSNGLSGMRERVMLLGGQFTIESVPGSGTRLTAELSTRMGGLHQ